MTVIVFKALQNIQMKRSWLKVLTFYRLVNTAQKKPVNNWTSCPSSVMTVRDNFASIISSLQNIIASMWLTKTVASHSAHSVCIIYPKEWEELMTTHKWSATSRAVANCICWPIRNRRRTSAPQAGVSRLHSYRSHVEAAINSSVSGIVIRATTLASNRCPIWFQSNDWWRMMLWELWLMQSDVMEAVIVYSNLIPIKSCCNVFFQKALRRSEYFRVNLTCCREFYF